MLREFNKHVKKFVFFKALTCSKNSLLKVFFYFVILIWLDVHIMPVCSWYMLHVSKNWVFDKMEPDRVCTPECVYIIWLEENVYLLVITYKQGIHGHK